MPIGQINARETPTFVSLTEPGKLGFLRRNTSGWLMLLAMLSVLLVACGGSASSDPASGPTADLVSDFPVTVYTGADTLGGAEINFSDLHGQPVVLNFWAGLCPPCRAEMPDLQEFYDEFQDRTVMVGVDVGQFTGLGTQDDAQALLDALEITYPTGFTTQGTVIQDYGVFSMPTTVFITSEGKVFRKWSGALNRDKLAEITNDMLSQEPG